MKYATIEDLQKGVDAAGAHTLPYMYADAATVTTFVDQIDLGDDTAGGDDIVGLAVTVYENKLFGLSIADDWLAHPDELTTVLNAVIVNTFFRYSQDHAENVQFARDFIDNHPVSREKAYEELRVRISQLRED